MALIVSVIAVIASLTLALSALRARRISPWSGIAMVAAWIVIFAAVAYLASTWVG